MNNRLTKIILTVIIIFGLIFLGSIFAVHQGQKGMLLRLGRMVENPQTKQTKELLPGLHVKWPFIETVRRFDTRIQTIDLKSSTLTTKGKKEVVVEYYVKWRIENLGLYFKSTAGLPFKGQSLLEQEVNTALREQFSKVTLSDLNSAESHDIINTLRAKVEEKAARMGIAIIDVQIKGLELPTATANDIYQAMRLDMQKLANQRRADGSSEKITIKAETDAEVLLIAAPAKLDAQLIRSKGEAKAAIIYADAFNQNKDFFALYGSYKAYIASFNSKSDILVLDPKISFLNNFFQGDHSNQALPK